MSDWHPALRWTVLLLGAVWAAPITLAGLLLGLVALAFGSRMRVADGALVFHRFPLGPGGALCLGNIILHTGNSMDEKTRTYACKAGGEHEEVRIGDHERAHVFQYLALGPLFPLFYFACGGVSARNRFEQAADRYAKTGRGWWPWPRDKAAAKEKARR